MNWLQISDLHIKDCADWEIMKVSYREILSAKKIDFVIVTGDLHNDGEDYEETKKFLDVIISATGIDKNSLYTIPGNHDSNDFDTKDALIDYILKHTPSDSEFYRKYEEKLKQSYQEYQTFYEQYFEVENYQVENVQVHTWNEKINILAINSSLICDGNNEHKQMVDIFKLAHVKIDNDYPTIAIGHHEIAYLFEEHKNVVQRIFTNLNVSAYLCGDLHKDSVRNIDSFKSPNKKILSITCGKSSIDNTDSYSDNSFILYEYDNESVGVVKVRLYKWDSVKKSFRESNDFDYDDEKLTFPLYRSENKNTTGANEAEKNSIKKLNKFDDILQLEGYVLIGPRGREGIKYIWKKNEKIIESLAFNERPNSAGLLPKDKNTSAYTASISHGCILKADNTQCIFCETGSKEFKGYLTAEDIALQNIFMAEYDSDCPSYPNVRRHSREFAYMGQGEPGHAYHLIRKSIMLTDYAMAVLNQDVSRYVISTSGIKNFIPLLLNDMINKNFKNRINLHFSLNVVGDDRNILMPINRENGYQDFIRECELFFDYTKEKVAVSLIIFNNLVLRGNTFSFTLNQEKLEQVLKILDPEKFRIDLRDFNSNNQIQLNGVSNEYATDLLQKVTDEGFEGKLFSCFGENENAAFGMLNSDVSAISKPGKTTLNHYNRAIELLTEAQNNI